MFSAYDYFDEYLEEKLSTEQKAIFDQQLLSDQTLADELALHKEVRLKLRREYLKQRIAEAAATMPKTEQSIPKSDKYFPATWKILGLLIVVSSLLFMLFNKYINSNNNVKNIDNQIIEPELKNNSTPVIPQEVPRSPTKQQEAPRAEKDNTLPQKDIVAVYFEQSVSEEFKEWEKNKEFLRGEEKAEKNEEYFFNACALMSKREYKAAFELFSQLEKSTTFRDVYEAQWYATLCFSKLYPQEKNTRLEEIITNDNNRFQETAKSFKNALNGIHQ